MSEFKTNNWFCDRADLQRWAFARESFEAPLQERWKIQLNGEIVSSCIGSEQEAHLFVGAGENLFCIEAESGHVVWNRSLDAHISSVPCLQSYGDKGSPNFRYMIFATTESGTLYMFDSFTAEEIWSNNPSTGSYPIVSSPTAAGPKYVAVVYQAHDNVSFIRLVDATNGETEREVPRFPITNNTPFYYNSRFIVGIERLGSIDSHDVIHAYLVTQASDLSVELLDWKLYNSNSKYGSKTSGIHVNKQNSSALEHVYSPAEGIIQAIHPVDPEQPINQSDPPNPVIWELTMPNDEPVHGFAYRFKKDQSDILDKTLIVGQANEVSAYSLDGAPTIKWRYAHDRNYPTGNNERIPQPAVTDKYVITVVGNKVLIALDVNTGSEVWKTELPAPTYASPMLTEDSIYIGCSNGELFAFSRP